MGVSFYSYAIIGVEINIQDLYTREYNRNCDCDIEFNADAPPKYCSGCGNAFLKETMENIEGFNGSRFNGWDVIFNTDRKKAVIGMTTASAREDSDKNISFLQMPAVDLTSIKEELKNALGTRFWDEKKFGLYSVMYCSY